LKLSEAFNMTKDRKMWRRSPDNRKREREREREIAQLDGGPAVP